MLTEDVASTLFLLSIFNSIKYILLLRILFITSYFIYKLNRSIQIKSHVNYQENKNGQLLLLVADQLTLVILFPFVEFQKFFKLLFRDS